LAVGSWQLAVGSWQLAVGSWQLAVGSGQLAVGSWQLAVGSGQLAVTGFAGFLDLKTENFARSPRAWRCFVATGQFARHWKAIVAAKEHKEIKRSIEHFPAKHLAVEIESTLATAQLLFISGHNQSPRTPPEANIMPNAPLKTEN